VSALVFMDTETTGLALTDDIWEFAGIRREEDGTQTELHLFVMHDETKCAKLPESFRADHESRWDSKEAVWQIQAAERIAAFMGGKAHIVGAVPNFDTERIALLLGRFNIKPDWHYHLIDVENLAVGYLFGTHKGSRSTPSIELPWDSDELSKRLGIEPPTDARHTAMGDALWARAIYDRVMGVTS
jgi:hypothetical protein